MTLTKFARNRKGMRVIMMARSEESILKLPTFVQTHSMDFLELVRRTIHAPIAR